MRTLPRLTEEQVLELETFSKGTKDIKEFKRGQAILLLNTNTKIDFIYKLTNYSRSQIFSLRQLYSRHGLVALKTKAKGEPKRLLTKEQLQEIITLLKEA